MTLPFDAYSLRARLFPALIATIPAAALIATLVSWTRFDPIQVVAPLALGALLYAFADIARRQGRRLEPALYEKMGGKPSVAMLRHRDKTLHADTKQRYLTFLAKKLGERAPTNVDEEADPARADAFYERCGLWLRENTREPKVYKILLEENITYGFRRNVLGMKGAGLSLNAVVVAIAAGITFIQHPAGSLSTFAFLLAVAIGHAIYFLFAVNEQVVAEAANTYARQLLSSCDKLMISLAPSSTNTVPSAATKLSPQDRAKSRARSKKASAF